MKDNDIVNLCNRAVPIEFCVDNYIGARSVLIYGAGSLGTRIFELLHSENCEVLAFIDRQPKSGKHKAGIPILRPGESAKLGLPYQEVCVVIAVCFPPDEYKSVTTILEDLGYQHIINGYEILTAYNFRYESERKLLKDKNYQAYILKAFRLLKDTQSRQVFYQNLKAHILNVYNDGSIPSEDILQYFDPGIDLRRGLKRFVDCGAYNGDTFSQLVALCIPDIYIGFEPDIHNFRQLSSHVEDTEDCQAFLYPCAVYSSNVFLDFDGERAGSSALKAGGSNTVQGVRLDDVLKNIHPTMIKMDIEGAELDAVKGAEQIIKTEKPDLAVCVYHKLSHLWEIVNLLSEWVPEYKFYLRCHYICTLETVLYATV